MTKIGQIPREGESVVMNLKILDLDQSICGRDDTAKGRNNAEKDRIPRCGLTDAFIELEESIKASVMA